MQFSGNFSNYGNKVLANISGKMNKSSLVRGLLSIDKAGLMLTGYIFLLIPNETWPWLKPRCHLTKHSPTPWFAMANHELPWSTMQYHGWLWNAMLVCGFWPCFVELHHGRSWSTVVNVVRVVLKVVKSWCMVIELMLKSSWKLILAPTFSRCFVSNQLHHCVY